MATGVTRGLWLRAVRDLVTGIPVIRRAKPARGDPLFQFFDFQHRHFEFSFHFVTFLDSRCHGFAPDGPPNWPVDRPRLAVNGRLSWFFEGSVQEFLIRQGEGRGFNGLPSLPEARL